MIFAAKAFALLGALLGVYGIACGVQLVLEWGCERLARRRRPRGGRIEPCHLEDPAP